MTSPASTLHYKLKKEKLLSTHTQWIRIVTYVNVIPPILSSYPLSKSYHYSSFITALQWWGLRRSTKKALHLRRLSSSSSLFSDKVWETSVWFLIIILMMSSETFDKTKALHLKRLRKEDGRRVWWECLLMIKRLVWSVNWLDRETVRILIPESSIRCHKICWELCRWWWWRICNGLVFEKGRTLVGLDCGGYIILQ